jgi:hypothetical protein
VNLFWFGVLVAGSEKDSPPPRPGLAFPLLVANSRSGHIHVLVWFRLGILVFTLISVAHLSSECF